MLTLKLRWTKFKKKKKVPKMRCKIIWNDFAWFSVNFKIQGWKMHKESFSVLERGLYLEYLGGLYQSCVAKLPIRVIFVIPSIHTVFNPDPVPQHNFFLTMGSAVNQPQRYPPPTPETWMLLLWVNRTGIVFSWLILSLLRINQRLFKYCECKTMKRVAIFPQSSFFTLSKTASLKFVSLKIGRV